MRKPKSNKMKPLNLFVSITTSTLLLLMSSFRADADIFSDINNAKRTIDGTRGNIQNTGSTISDLGKMFGIGNNSGSGDTNTQSLSIYADWYKTMSPMDKEVVNMLATEYAERGSLDFTTFKATNFYKIKTIEDRQRISATFFKFNEVVKIAPKDKFLAYAFCVNGGGTNCK